MAELKNIRFVYKKLNVYSTQAHTRYNAVKFFWLLYKYDN